MDRKEYQRKYHLENRERLRELKRANLIKWRKLHPEKAAMLSRLNKQVWRARKKQLRIEPRLNKKLIHNWDTRICGICDTYIEKEYHIDHIMPLSRGGNHTVTNLQLAHPYCNRSKFTKLPEEMNISIMRV